MENSLPVRGIPNARTRNPWQSASSVPKTAEISWKGAQSEENSSGAAVIILSVNLLPGIDLFQSNVQNAARIFSLKRETRRGTQRRFVTKRNAAIRKSKSPWKKKLSAEGLLKNFSLKFFSEVLRRQALACALKQYCNRMITFKRTQTEVCGCLFRPG